MQTFRASPLMWLTYFRAIPIHIELLTVKRIWWTNLVLTFFAFTICGSGTVTQKEGKMQIHCIVRWTYGGRSQHQICMNQAWKQVSTRQNEYKLTTQTSGVWISNLVRYLPLGPLTMTLHPPDVNRDECSQTFQDFSLHISVYSTMNLFR